MTDTKPRTIDLKILDALNPGFLNRFKSNIVFPKWNFHQCWLFGKNPDHRKHRMFSVKYIQSGVVVVTQLYAHRISYAIEHGAIGENHLVMHTCDRPNCVNPSHLELGTPYLNQLEHRKSKDKQKRDFEEVTNPPAKVDTDLIPIEGGHHSPRLDWRLSDIWELPEINTWFQDYEEMIKQEDAA